MTEKRIGHGIARAVPLLALVFACSGEPAAREKGTGPRPTGGADIESGGQQGHGGVVSTGGIAKGGGAIAVSGGTAGTAAGGAGQTGGAAGGSRAGGAGGTSETGGNTGGSSARGGATASGGAGGSNVGTGGRTTGSGGASSSGGGLGSGGVPSSGGATGTGGSSAATFDWGATAYSASGGASIRYQGHYTGQGCIGTACHNHTISYGGTVYQSNGTTTAGNVQIGILMGATLTTTYSGTQGNFYGNLSGTDWANAVIAIRNASGTAVMPANSKATGNCNNCHSSSNRIVAP